MLLCPCFSAVGLGRGDKIMQVLQQSEMLIFATDCGSDDAPDTSCDPVVFSVV